MTGENLILSPLITEKGTAVGEEGNQVVFRVRPEASKDAIRDVVERMIAHLTARTGLSPEDAYVLCSVAVDLKVSEVVDAPNWVVSAFLPKDLVVG